MSVETEVKDKSPVGKGQPEYYLDDKAIDANNWAGHEDQITQLFSLYREKVNPLISIYNSLENSFPIGVINELRDIFSHLTLSLLSSESSEIDRHFDKAQRHLKRAVVDAFKYVSMAYSKVYDDFKKSYEHVDLGYIDQGNFLPKIVKLNAEAEDLMLKAKMIESELHDDDAMYEAYEDAFNCYAELYQCIMDALDEAEVIRLKANQDEEARKKEHRTDRIIGIVGAVVGIVGMVVGILGLCM